MPTIRSIRPSRAALTVVLDDGADFRCSRDFAVRARLGRGQQIDDVILRRLMNEAARDFAHTELGRLVRKRRHSRAELVRRLQQAGVRPSDIRAALDEAPSVDLAELEIAAQATERAWAREQRRGRATAWSDFRVHQARRLAMRGFPPAVISAALEQAAESVAPDRLRAYPESRTDAVSAATHRTT